MRWVGVDWSGRVDPRAHLWVAEHDGASVVALAAGRRRAEVVDHLIALADADGDLIVGLDFSFGLPAWFAPHAPELWAHPDTERWLAKCPWPFWGRPGVRRPVDVEQYCATELALRAAGLPAKSTFQIGGAGAVGTASLRGWSALRTLRAAGFAIWPFDPPQLPLVLEVYPRACTGPLVKSDPAARHTWLAARQLPATGGASEDALDALAVAVALVGTTTMPPAPHPLAPIEGWVWVPPVRAS